MILAFAFFLRVTGAFLNETQVVVFFNIWLPTAMPIVCSAVTPALFGSFVVDCDNQQNGVAASLFVNTTRPLPTLLVFNQLPTFLRVNIINNITTIASTVFPGFSGSNQVPLKITLSIRGFTLPQNIFDDLARVVGSQLVRLQIEDAVVTATSINATVADL